MNPRNGGLSRAMRNRCVEINLDADWSPLPLRDLLDLIQTPPFSLLPAAGEKLVQTLCCQGQNSSRDFKIDFNAYQILKCAYLSRISGRLCFCDDSGNLNFGEHLVRFWQKFLSQMCFTTFSLGMVLGV